MGEDEGVGLRQLLDYYFVLRTLHVEQCSLQDRTRSMAQKVGQIASYTLNKGFDDEYYRDLIVKALKQHGSLSRKDVDALLIKKLPDALDEKQKLNKVGNLLTQLRVAGTICVGEKKKWVLR